MIPPIQRSSVLLSLSSVLLLLILGGCGGSTSGSGGGGGGGGTPTTITIIFSGIAPTAVATQTGTGSFSAASLTSGKLTISVPSGTINYAVAYTCPPVSLGAPLNIPENFIHVWEAAISDGSTFTQSCGNGNAGFSTATLTGSVDATAIAGASQVDVVAFNSTNSVVAGASPNSGSFSMAAPAGADRVEELTYDSTSHLLAAKDMGSQTAPGAVNGGTPVTFAASDQVSYQPITYSNVPAGYMQPNSFASILLGTSAAASLSFGHLSQYPVLPASALENGDTYTLISTASVGSSPSASVGVFQTFTSAQPVTVSFPAPFTPVAPTPAAWPAFPIQYSGFSSGSISYVALSSWTIAGANSFQFEVTSTAAHQSGSSTLAIPDLTGISGFPSAPASSTVVNWSTAVVQSSYPPGLGTPLNATLDEVIGIGQYTVP